MKCKAFTSCHKTSLNQDMLRTHIGLFFPSVGSVIQSVRASAILCRLNVSERLGFAQACLSASVGLLQVAYIQVTDCHARLRSRVSFEVQRNSRISDTTKVMTLHSLGLPFMLYSCPAQVTRLILHLCLFHVAFAMCLTSFLSQTKRNFSFQLKNDLSCRLHQWQLCLSCYHISTSER